MVLYKYIWGAISSQVSTRYHRNDDVSNLENWRTIELFTDGLYDICCL